MFNMAMCIYPTVTLCIILEDSLLVSNVPPPPNLPTIHTHSTSTKGCVILVELRIVRHNISSERAFNSWLRRNSRSKFGPTADNREINI